MQTVIATMSVSLDGVGSGRNQTEQRPFGDVDHRMLHRWMFETPEESRAEMDAIVSAGAYIMGRNMFGPVRGEWSGDWRGWWGVDPPYHAPVFVLTHHPRESLVMEGGTTFHFVTDGIEAALERARDAAGDRPIHIAGGPSTTNAYLAAGLVDELMLQIAPVVIGDGLRLFDGVGALDLQQIAVRPVSLATHVRYRVNRSREESVPAAAPAVTERKGTYEPGGSDEIAAARDALRAHGREAPAEDSLRLQAHMDRRSKAFETLSNTLKKTGESQQDIIDNLK